MMSAAQFRTAIFVLAMATGLSCREPNPTHGVSMGDPQPAAALKLTAANGERFDLAAQKGKTVLVFFGYTHCPDFCPNTLSEWAKAHQTLGKLGSKVRFVFVAVDPERDTPRVAHDYVMRFDSAFVGLAANADQLELLKTTWGFAAGKEEMPGMAHDNYGVMHPARSFVVDAKGRLTMYFPPGTRADDIAAGIKELIR